MNCDEFLQIADLFAEPAFLLGRDGTVHAVNRAVDTLGYRPEHLTGRNLNELWAAPETVIEDYLSLCFRSKEPIIGSLLLIAEDGQVLSCIGYGALLDGAPAGHVCKDPAGSHSAGKDSQVVLRVSRKEFTPSHFSILNQKISELSTEIHRRLQAEDQLRDQTEWLSVTLSSIGDAVLTTDHEGRVTFLNPEAERMTGWTDAEARERPLHEVFQIINEHTREPVEPPVHRVLQEGVVVGMANHTVLVARDGVRRPIEDSAAPIRRGSDVAGVVLVFRDVTEKNTARVAIEESEQRFRQLAEHITDVFWIADPARPKVLYVSPAYTQIWNRSSESLYQRPRSFLKSIHREDRPQVLEAIGRQARGETTTEEFRVVRPDGSVRWVSDRAFPIKDESGRVYRVAGIAEDITERRLASEALRESEARLRRIVESNVIALVVGDYQGRVIEANDAYLQLVGYSREDLRKGRLNFIELTPPEFQDLDRRAMEQMATSGRHDPFEKEYMRRDGTRVPVLVGTAYLGKDKNGNELGVKFVLDLTERKKAEQALRESEEKLRLMADTIPQLAWMARPDGYIFWFNRRWYEYTGLEHEQVEGWGWQAVHDPQYLPEVLKNWRSSLASGKPFGMVFPLKGNDGQFRPFLTRVNPLRDQDGQILYWFGTSTDISEQKRAEDAFRFLAEASAALATVVDYQSTLQMVATLAVPRFGDWCAVDIAQPNGTLMRRAVTHVDAEKVHLAYELAQRYPFQGDSAVGPPMVARTGQPEILQMVPESLLVALSRDRDHLELLRQLGLKSYLSVPMKARGKVIGVLTFVSSTGRHYSESDLEVAEDLAHRAGVAVENARLYEALKDADRRKDEFLATLAHELRNPLAPIRTGLEVLKLAGDDRNLANETREVMQKQLEHMVRLVDDLLEVSRITRGKLQLRKERVELNSAITSAIEAARPLIDDAGHTLKLNLLPEPIYVDADPTRLSQIFTNLLSNAAKYTDRAGVIELTVTRNEEHLTVSVRDSGIGIPAEHLSKIFEMFSQVDSAIERSQGGLGIGLSLVRALVEMHGGAVEAKSEGPGKGSEFIVRLPILKTHKEQPQEAPPSEETRRRFANHRILVVDDNKDAARCLAMLLKIMGNETATAHDGAEAIEAAREFRPDIVLLDIGMPKMNGYEVARSIRKAAWGQGMILVAVTGWGQEEDKRRAVEAGFNLHLTKPIEASSLHKLLISLNI
ncbi:MAG: PAS domain S-box protein [Aureliella sp.]